MEAATSDHPAPPPSPPPEADVPPPPQEPFRWDLLLLPLQESILAHLPISTLIVLTTVSRSLRATIRSRSFLSAASSLRRCNHISDDVLLLAFSSHSASVSYAFHPFTNRWISLRDLSGMAVASSSSLYAIPNPRNHFSFINPFSKSLTRTPPLYPMTNPSALALFDETTQSASLSHHYHLLVVSTHDRRAQLYRSSSDTWELTGDLPKRFTCLASAVFLCPLLFVLARGPDRLLCFDPRSVSWSLMGVKMPDADCVHLLGFDHRLFMVGAVQEVGAIVKIGIWRLDGVEKKWVVVVFMPQEFFEEFRGGRLDRFDVVDRLGKIYFHNPADTRDLMYDLLQKRWWWPMPCPVPMDRRCWLGHALEHSLDLLKR